MGMYRLYTVVPRLVKFLESLTNVYVRFNRKRMKGGSGADDALVALTCLFDVLLNVCKVMAPFTPFLTENMYQNLAKCLPADQALPSVHFCSFPEETEAQQGDERIQASVERMQTVVELARTIRERKNKPIKFPLKSLVVVHSDQAFLDDIQGGGQSRGPEVPE
jgi:isoleucyl-tRNA synthetase